MNPCDIVPFCIGQDGSQVSSLGTKEFVNIAMYDLVRVVSIASERRQGVARRVLRHVPFRKRKPHDLPCS